MAEETEQAFPTTNFTLRVGASVVNFQVPANRPGWDAEVDRLTGKAGSAWSGAISNVCYHTLSPKTREAGANAVLEEVSENWPNLVGKDGQPVMMDSKDEAGNLVSVPKPMTEVQVFNWLIAEGKVKQERLDEIMQECADDLGFEAEHLKAGRRKNRKPKKLYFERAKAYLAAVAAGNKPADQSDANSFTSIFEKRWGVPFSSANPEGSSELNETTLAFALQDHDARKLNKEDF